MVSVPAASCSTSWKGCERRPAQRVDRQVPRAQRLHAERGPVLLLDLSHQRDHDPLDGLVEPDRVGDAVVEPLAVAEGVLHEIGEPRLARDLDPELFHLVEQVIERLAILEPPVGGELPGFLADGAVGLFQKRRHLGQGPLLAAKGDGHRADDLLILLLQLGQLRSRGGCSPRETGRGGSPGRGRRRSSGRAAAPLGTGQSR